MSLCTTADCNNWGVCNDASCDFCSSCDAARSCVSNYWLKDKCPNADLDSFSCSVVDGEGSWKAQCRSALAGWAVALIVISVLACVGCGCYRLAVIRQRRRAAVATVMDDAYNQRLLPPGAAAQYAPPNVPQAGYGYPPQRQQQQQPGAQPTWPSSAPTAV